MSLIDHIGAQLQDKIKQRVWESVKATRESLMRRLESEIRLAVNTELAEALAEAADIALVVSESGTSVRIEPGRVVPPAMPPIAPPTPPIVDVPPAVEAPTLVDPVAPTPEPPVDVPANPGRGGA